MCTMHMLTNWLVICDMASGNSQESMSPKVELDMTDEGKQWLELLVDKTMNSCSDTEIRHLAATSVSKKVIMQNS